MKLCHAGKWVELEIIVFSEIKRSHKGKYCLLSLICSSIWVAVVGKNERMKAKVAL
jgi:hypothetical protein